MDAFFATRAAEMIKAGTVVPMHYKTFPLLAQSADGFKPAGITVREMAPGQTWSFGK